MLVGAFIQTCFIDVRIEELYPSFPTLITRCRTLCAPGRGAGGGGPGQPADPPRPPPHTGLLGRRGPHARGRRTPGHRRPQHRRARRGGQGRARGVRRHQPAQINILHPPTLSEFNKSDWTMNCCCCVCVESVDGMVSVYPGIYNLSNTRSAEGQLSRGVETLC